MTRLVFAATMFLSAALLFVVQPMTGKQLLPLAGGTPAVWNTCLVFFQAALLLGYLYAHGLGRLPVSRQLAIHAAVLAAGFALVVLFGWLRPDSSLIRDDAEYPVFGLVAGLAACVGGPFLMLSATAPLLQKWFAAASHRDPYPLYAASNAGSLIGLFGYPFLVEPLLPVTDQRTWWMVGYAACAGLLMLCGWRSISDFRFQISDCKNRNPDSDAPAGVVFKSEIINLKSAIRWVALAALTSSLLMSVTTHLTTDVAPVPLLWAVPLGLYLASFVMVFARWPDRLHHVVGRVTPMALCGLVVALATGATDPPAAVAAIHLGTFFLVCLLCHGELARSRPPADRLTEFYLWISFGGVLGGLFNALVAPVLFANLGLVEYPLAVVLAALVRPGWRPTKLRWDDLAAPAMLFVVTFVLVFLPQQLLGDGPAGRVFRVGLAFGLPAAVAFALAWRPVRFALALAAVLFAATLDPRRGEVLDVSRNFFGTLRVTRDSSEVIRLWHGTTQHGSQFATDRDQPAPLAYYHRKGPLGRLFAGGAAQKWHRVGVVGLGSGAMAAYAEPHQRWTFYEIDPAVVRVARDERFFTYLSTSRAASLDVVLGDARRQLAREPDGTFDLLVLDAFSSDAIPVHLLTAEAFALYRSKLRPGGVLAFHLSNRYLDLPPLVARLAADADSNLVVRMDEDGAVSDTEAAAGKLPATWVFVAGRLEDLGERRLGQVQITPLRGRGWTDDFSNVLGVWRRDD